MKLNKKMTGKNADLPLEYICFTEKKKYIIYGLPEGWEDVLTLVVNKEGEICYAKNYEKILQISSKKVIGRMLRKLEPDAVMLQVLKNGRPDFNIERRLPSIRGLTVKAIDIPLLYEGGVVGGLIFYAPQEKSTKIELLKINVESCLGRLIIQSSSLLSSDSIHLWSGNKIIGRSYLFREALKLAINVARTNFDVLLSGETGVGKEVFAEVIHLCSARRQGPFVKINCAAIPESLFESELFGYEGGSFTGANPKGKKGLFEEANGGTLFLDEVGEVSLNTQGKILRALQNKEVQRVGGKKPRTVDVRVIAATNRNLNELVSEGAFREDLYYRLNVIPICIPPLRLREYDLDLIADYIYANIQSQTGITIQNFDDLKGLFMVYDWPGNIRQLENIIRYAAILSVETGNAHLDDIRKRLSETGEGCSSRQEDEATVYIRPGVTLQRLNEELEMKALKVALKNSNYNKTLASSLLGISRQTFYQKLHQYKIINGG